VYVQSIPTCWQWMHRLVPGACSQFALQSTTEHVVATRSLPAILVAMVWATRHRSHLALSWNVPN
jgi:hypothetical protein